MTIILSDVIVKISASFPFHLGLWECMSCGDCQKFILPTLGCKQLRTHTANFFEPSLPSTIISVAFSILQICKPIEGEEEQKDVIVIKESKKDMMKEYERAALRLDKAKLVLRRLIDVQKAKARASKDDPLELRSPVTKDALVAEVARQLCVNIAPENLHLPVPLATLGEYEVPLRLPRSIPLPEGKLNWTLKVKIRSR
ncbi:hypothetical protein Ahy_A04g018991 isoform D [Arachis hypogaea]|uniref:Uncharacterized protein n=1 Tax=Arachis hypogaea TaxID=3818 RepID=A0A445DF79_ARAHY|nr:hypothetical protein Ahy_A04g018991 isoform D [Arachis hypogaea]